MTVWTWLHPPRRGTSWNRARSAIGSVVLAAVFMVLSATPAAAGAKWCEDDPVISVDGRVAHVTVAFFTSNIPRLSGKIAYEVYVAPSYVSTTTVDATLAFLPTTTAVYPLTDDSMKKRWGDGVKVVVRSYVPSSKTFPTITTVTDFAGAQIERRNGHSNAWVEVAFTLP